MSNKGVNILQFLTGQTPNASKPVVPTVNTRPISNYSTTGAAAVPRSSWIRIVSYILAILIVILVILLFIHFFIKPIFQFKPGGSGIIPVPGFDDGNIFWNKTTPGQILNKDLPIATQTYNYSVNLDVFIENPLQFSTYPRVFFTRGASNKDTPSGNTLLGVLNYYNVCAALMADTNDMIVSVMNQDNHTENVVISNVPVQEPFRLGIVVLEQALEVYINGHLMKTRKFASPPMDVKGDIYPAPGIMANVVKLRNLKIWPRILTTSEIRYATPSLSTAKDFGAVPMPSSTSCSTTPSSIMNSEQKAADRMSKLSIETVPDLTTSLF
jgi:hypothetical protein